MVPKGRVLGPGDKGQEVGGSRQVGGWVVEEVSEVREGVRLL